MHLLPFLRMEKSSLGRARGDCSAVSHQLQGVRTIKGNDLAFVWLAALAAFRVWGHGIAFAWAFAGHCLDSALAPASCFMHEVPDLHLPKQHPFTPWEESKKSTGTVSVCTRLRRLLCRWFPRKKRRLRSSLKPARLAGKSRVKGPRHKRARGQKHAVSCSYQASNDRAAVWAHRWKCGLLKCWCFICTCLNFWSPFLGFLVTRPVCTVLNFVQGVVPCPPAVSARSKYGRHRRKQSARLEAMHHVNLHGLNLCFRGGGGKGGWL